MADFETLVDRIYEASADAELWSEVMQDVAGAVDAAGGIILTRRSDSWLGWRYSPAMAPGAEAYMRDGALRSRSTSRLLALERSSFSFIVEEDVFPIEDEYLADPMMTDWGGPAGLHHAAVTAIRVPTDDMVVIQLNRRAGRPQFGRDEIATLDALRPHLARAGLLAARWRLGRLRAAAEALAMIGLPAAVLGADGRLLAANSLIEAQRAHLVFLPHDRVALVDRAADALLRRAVAEIHNPAAVSVRSFAAKGQDGSPVVVHLIPATRRARDLFDGGFAILALTPVAAPQAPDVALIRGLFDLTAAEARIACGVAEGLTTEQIAARHGTTRETVRHQLKSVFGKTGVARQSQLAALIVGQGRHPLAPPEHADDETVVQIPRTGDRN
jgi:DNA-binding CsgD family transcriptional regulator